MSTEQKMDVNALIDNCDPTDANFCMDALDAGKKLARYAQRAIDADNSGMRMGRDNARDLAVAIMDYAVLIGAVEHGTTEGLTEFHEEIAK